MATLNTSGATAAARVLNTAELFEQILLRVDMQTLLVTCQRVNHFWSDFINDSTKLQQRLFLKPITHIREAVELRMLDDVADDTFLTIPYSAYPKILGRNYYDIRSSTMPDRCALLNPLLYSGYGIPHSPVLRPIYLEKTETGYPSASWRKMLVAQPPTVHRIICWGARGGFTFGDVDGACTPGAVVDRWDRELEWRKNRGQLRCALNAEECEKIKEGSDWTNMFGYKYVGIGLETQPVKKAALLEKLASTGESVADEEKRVEDSDEEDDWY